MNFKPILDMRATSMSKAFFLNALILAIVAAGSIELRNVIEIRVETKKLSRLRKVVLTTIGSFIMGMLTYILIRFIFGYGEGLIGRPPFSKTLL